ncbi:hypothetical protein EJ110_NYTH10193 [Nymphaea thermarum]|nr:hypothetical protein EJ110_NYTH10193 [Nymphaea thermarum]
MLAVFSLEASCEKEKRNVLQIVADVPGIDHRCTDTNGKNLRVAVVGTMDQNKLQSKLRNKCNAKMLKLDNVEEYLKNAAAIGIDRISMDMKEMKLTVVGDVDPIDLVNQLRTLCQADILAEGPAMEEKNDKPNEEKSREYTGGSA